MPDRIIDISERPAHLSVQTGNLVIRVPEIGESRMPVGDIAVVVVSHPQATFTHAALSELAAHGASLVVCDRTRLPTAMLLPLQANYVQVERFSRQVAASQPRRKRLWQQIVRNKLQSQAALLTERHGSDAGLLELAGKVRSGDPQNMEAQAARRYWASLFGDQEFRRNREAEDVNVLLNYGYTVLRACVARAVCAAGLHPSIGLHHHNRYSQFTLADDLMEPFRVIIDRAAARLQDQLGPALALDRQSKTELIGAVSARYVLGGERRTLFDIVSRSASSLVDVFAGERDRLVLPEFPEFLEWGESEA